MENVIENVTETKMSWKESSTQICKKCGTEYPLIYRECPTCGFSKIRQITKVTAVILFVIAVATMLTLSGIKVNKLEKQVIELQSRVDTLMEMLTDYGYTEGDDTIDITELDYFRQNVIYDGAILDKFENDYLVYALQDGCSACAEFNTYVYMFLYYGYNSYIPVYFITPDSAPSLFFDYFDCTDTPTLYRMNNGKIVDKASGVDDAFQMMDSIVNEAEEAINKE